MGYSDIYHINGQDFFHQLYLIIFGGLTFGLGRYDGMILFFAIGFPLPNSGSARCRRGRCISELYGFLDSKKKVHKLLFLRFEKQSQPSSKTLAFILGLEIQMGFHLEIILLEVGNFNWPLKDWKSGGFHHHFFHWVSSVKKGSQKFQRTDVPGRKLVTGCRFNGFTIFPLGFQPPFKQWVSI